MLERLLAILYEPIINHLEGLMASVEDLNAKLEQLQEQLAEAKDRITEDVEELRRLIREGIDPAELEPISAKLDSLLANVQAIDPDPEFPPEPARG